MKTFFTFLAIIFATTFATGQHLCGAPTKSTGLPCKNRVKESGQKCHLHKNGNTGHVASFNDAVASMYDRSNESATSATQCAGKTKKGLPCKNKTKDSSGYCHLHRNQNK